MKVVSWTLTVHMHSYSAANELGMMMATAAAPVKQPPWLCPWAHGLTQPQPLTFTWLPSPPWASPWTWPTLCSLMDMSQYHGLGWWPGPLVATPGLSRSPGHGDGPCPAGSPSLRVPFSQEQLPDTYSLSSAKHLNEGVCVPWLVKQQGLSEWCSHSTCVFWFSGFDIDFWRHQPWNFTYRTMKIKSLMVLCLGIWKKNIFCKKKKEA